MRSRNLIEPVPVIVIGGAVVGLGLLAFALFKTSVKTSDPTMPTVPPNTPSPERGNEPQWTVWGRYFWPDPNNASARRCSGLYALWTGPESVARWLAVEWTRGNDPEGWIAIALPRSMALPRSFYDCAAWTVELARDGRQVGCVWSDDGTYKLCSGNSYAGGVVAPVP